MLRNERGNAIFYSLIAVGLVATISTTVVHMMNQLSNSAARMSRRFVADTVERTMMLISSDRHVCGNALRDAANNPIVYTGADGPDPDPDPDPINIPRIRVGGTTMLEAGQPINMYNATSVSDVRLVSITFQETNPTQRKLNQPLGTAQGTWSNTIYNTYTGNLTFAFEPSRTSFFSGGGFTHTVPFDVAAEPGNANRITWCSGRKTVAGLCQDLGGKIDANGNCSPTLTSFDCSHPAATRLPGNCIGARQNFSCRDQWRVISIDANFVPTCECFRSCCARVCCNITRTITSSNSSPMGSPCPAGGPGTVLLNNNTCVNNYTCPSPGPGPTGGCVTGTWNQWTLLNYGSCPGANCGNCRDEFDQGSI